MRAKPAIELRRHFETLTDQETDEVVEVVADLIVHYVKGRRIEEPVQSGQGQAHG